MRRFPFIKKDGFPTVLQQRHAGFPADTVRFFVPDGGLHLADVGLAQQQHTQAALADAAADGQGQLVRSAASCGRAAARRLSQPASVS